MQNLLAAMVACTVSAQPTRIALLIAQRALERFYRKITPGAIALVFFSGYGTAPILGVAN